MDDINNDSDSILPTLRSISKLCHDNPEVESCLVVVIKREDDKYLEEHYEMREMLYRSPAVEEKIQLVRLMSGTASAVVDTFVPEEFFLAVQAVMRNRAIEMGIVKEDENG